jgi:hypothetical protein
MKEYVDIRMIINASLALFIAASQGASAMEDSAMEDSAMEDKGRVSSGLPRNNYETILQEIEELTARIHAEVEKVLADYRRDTEEYHRRMGLKMEATTTTPKKEEAPLEELIKAAEADLARADKFYESAWEEQNKMDSSNNGEEYDSAARQLDVAYAAYKTAQKKLSDLKRKNSEESKEIKEQGGTESEENLVKVRENAANHLKEVKQKKQEAYNAAMGNHTFKNHKNWTEIKDEEEKAKKSLLEAKEKLEAWRQGAAEQRQRMEAEKKVIEDAAEVERTYKALEKAWEVSVDMDKKYARGRTDALRQEFAKASEALDKAAVAYITALKQKKSDSNSDTSSPEPEENKAQGDREAEGEESLNKAVEEARKHLLEVRAKYEEANKAYHETDTFANYIIKITAYDLWEQASNDAGEARRNLREYLIKAK